MHFKSLISVRLWYWFDFLLLYVNLVIVGIGLTRKVRPPQPPPTPESKSTEIPIRLWADTECDLCVSTRHLDILTRGSEMHPLFNKEQRFRIQQSISAGQKNWTNWNSCSRRLLLLLIKPLSLFLLFLFLDQLQPQSGHAWVSLSNYVLLCVSVADAG